MGMFQQVKVPWNEYKVVLNNTLFLESSFHYVKVTEIKLLH